jgi:hypothetical protein
MIREYKDGDLEQIDFNEYSEIIRDSENFERMTAFLSNHYAYTIIDERPIAILAFFEYDKDKYDGCFIADKAFGKRKHIFEVKDAIYSMFIGFGAKRVQTTSHNTPKLNKWHKFLGFELEKSGKNNLWRIEWELKRHY